LVQGTVINNTLQAIKDERKVGSTLTSKAGEVRAKGFIKPKDFASILNNLVNLVTKRKGELYPLLQLIHAGRA